MRQGNEPVQLTNTGNGRRVVIVLKSPGAEKGKKKGGG